MDFAPRLSGLPKNFSVSSVRSCENQAVGAAPFIVLLRQPPVMIDLHRRESYGGLRLRASSR